MCMLLLTIAQEHSYCIRGTAMVLLTSLPQKCSIPCIQHLPLSKGVTVPTLVSIETAADHPEDNLSSAFEELLTVT